MELLHFIAQFRSDIGNIFFQYVTFLAQEPIVIGIICWLFWCSNKKLAYNLGFSYFTSGILVQGLKITFRIPRPWILDSEFIPVKSAIADATGYSFPSGHTQSITALLGTLGLCCKKIWRCICFAIIFLVGFSRMYLGCHTLKDVLTSFLITILCVFVCHNLFYKKEPNNKQIAIISILFTIVSILLVFYTLYLYKIELIATEYAQDCLKAGGAGVAFAIGYFLENKFISFPTNGSLLKKIIRFLFGLIIALLLQTGLKPILGASLSACFIRYFIVVFWIIVIYPYIFHNILHQKQNL